MTVPVPERRDWRRIAELERQVDRLEQIVRRLSSMRHTQPIAGRLWRFTLNEAFSSNEAEADLLALDGTDTNRDVVVHDPLDIGTAMGVVNGTAGWCVEQLDVDGTRLYQVIHSPIPLKMFCRFTLGAALATTDASKAATIQAQYGPGANHASNSITAYNLADNTGTAYVFEGDNGDAGFAIWDSGTNWRIVQMECP